MKNLEVGLKICKVKLVNKINNQNIKAIQKKLFQTLKTFNPNAKLNHHFK